MYILNYYYQGSVEAQIYDVLRDRLQVFRVAVGPLQPVLGGIARRIERVAMADPTERSLVLDREREALDAEIERAKQKGINVDAVADTQAAPPDNLRPPCRPEDVETIIRASQDLARLLAPDENEAALYRATEETLTSGFGPGLLTFRQDILESRPDTVQHCLSWGDPVFETLLRAVPAPSANEWNGVQRARLADGRVEYRRRDSDGQRIIRSVGELQECLDIVQTEPDA